MINKLLSPHLHWWDHPLDCCWPLTHSAGVGNLTSRNLTFTEQGANRIQILKGIAADGSETFTSWTAPITGGIVTFTAGQGPNGGASLRVVDDKTLFMTQNLPKPKVGASRTFQVSGDGETLTMTVIHETGRERAKMAFSRQ